VTVAGLLTTATGLGESARLCHAALGRLGLPRNALDLSATIGRIDLSPSIRADDAPARGEGGVLVVHLNAPHLPIGLALIGRARVRRKRIVGYWAWELEVLPRSWRRGLRCVHEVWVPSAFVATAMRRASDLPVRVVPHPVATPPRSGLGRAEVVGRLSQIATITVGLILAVDQLGVNSTVLVIMLVAIFACTFGAGAMAFGLGARDAVGNIIGMHYFSSAYKTDDRIRIGEVEGRVVAKSSVSVTLETEEGLVTVPGNMFSTRTTILLSSSRSS